MTLIAAFIINGILSFAIVLVIATALGPSEFGRYALAISLVAALSTILFEGLRLATLRFYSSRTRSERPAIRATLEVGYGLLALLVVMLAGFVLLSCMKLSGLSSCVLAAAGGTVLGQALFEYHGALARARFEQRTYVRLIGVKNFAALFLVVAALGVLGYLTLIGRNSVRLPWRDIALSLLATAVMIAAVWPLQDIGSPPLRLIATMTLGFGIYSALVWFMDLASLRTLARRSIERFVAERRGHDQPFKAG